MEPADEDLWKWNRWQVGVVTLVLAIGSLLGVAGVTIADMPVFLKTLSAICLVLFAVLNGYITRWCLRSRRRT